MATARGHVWCWHVAPRPYTAQATCGRASCPRAWALLVAHPSPCPCQVGCIGGTPISGLPIATRQQARWPLGPTHHIKCSQVTCGTCTTSQTLVLVSLLEARPPTSPHHPSSAFTTSGACIESYVREMSILTLLLGTKS